MLEDINKEVMQWTGWMAASFDLHRSPVDIIQVIVHLQLLRLQSSMTNALIAMLLVSPLN